MELVSARMNAGVVQEYSVVGELSLTLNPPPVTDSQIVLKIANADTLSKVRTRGLIASIIKKYIRVCCFWKGPVQVYDSCRLSSPLLLAPVVLSVS